MSDSDLPILKNITNDIMPALGTENLIIEAVQSLVKDEIKRYIRAKLDEDEALRAELKKAVELYMEAKLKELYYGMKIAKTGAKLGFSLIPDKLKGEITGELGTLLEKEMAQILERSFE